jgi:16S rRNA (uracil1498-N3)-methyltransferase
MQQFFTDVPLQAGEDYIFTKEQAHHARDVVRLHDETVRLVYQGQAYFARTEEREGTYIAHVTAADPHVNELPGKVILAMALIRKEKMELVYQKASELGVHEIIPVETERCVVKDDRRPGRLIRRQTIVREAAQQCKRNRIPLVHETIRLTELETVQADVKAAAYEKAKESGKMLSELKLQGTILIVIGPEGGFSENEAQWLAEHGFEAVSLGARILRAETAALYACSVISEILEKNR